MASRLSKEFPWSDVLNGLMNLFESRDIYNQSVLQAVRTKMVRMWGDVTSVSDRKATLKAMKEGFGTFLEASCNTHVISTLPNVPKTNCPLGSV